MSRMDQFNHNGEQPQKQLACIVAKPEVLERMLAAQETIARTQIVTADMMTKLAEASQFAARAYGAAFMAFLLALATLIVVLCK